MLVNKLIEIPGRILRIAPADTLLRLDRFILKKGFVDDRGIAKMIIEKGGVLVNDKVVTFPSKRLKEGDNVFIRNILVPFISGRQQTLNIIYRDEHIVVINKPPGFLSLPDEKSTVPAVYSILKKSIGVNLIPVHRLDKDTSGIMVFALHPAAGDNLKSQFSARKVEKTYIALVQGHLATKDGAIKGVMKTTGEYGESTFKIIETFKNATLVEVHPKTGRTNQIRIQFFELGHPLLGEYKYLKNSKTPLVVVPRIALHAFSIRFIHPGDSKIVEFSAEMPDDLKSIIDFLRNSA